MRYNLNAAAGTNAYKRSVVLYKTLKDREIKVGKLKSLSCFVIVLLKMLSS